MSETIDSRVVQMTFDNQKFERNIAKSQKSLSSFKTALDQLGDGAGTALSSLTQLADTVALSRIADGVDAIGRRIESVTSFAGRMIEQLEENAIRAASRIGRSLFITPATSGMSKYESMTNAKQTMKAALGADKMGDIDSALKALQGYADETSYSFSTMTGALASFVAAGQKDLPKSTKSIMGIANAAAKAGVGISAATPAFNAFAKAMSAGKMTIRQWDTLDTVLKLTTEDFRQKLIDAAVEAGTLVKDQKTGKVRTKDKKTEVTVGTVRDTLNKGWVTSEVMQSVLNAFADDEVAYAAAQNAKSFTDVWDAAMDAVSSSWNRTYELIFGDLDEAIGLFTGMANRLIEYLGEINDARNRVLEGWRGDGLGKQQAKEALRLKENQKAVEEYTAANSDYLKETRRYYRDGKLYEKRIFQFDDWETYIDERGRKKRRKRQEEQEFEISTDARTIEELNAYLDSIVDGRDQLIQAGNSLFDAFSHVRDMIGAGLSYTVFAELGGKLKEASVNFAAFSGRVSDFFHRGGISVALRNIGLGLGSVIDLAGQLGGALFGGLKDLAKPFGPVLESTMKLAGRIGVWLNKQRQLTRQNKTFQNGIAKLTKAFKPLTDLLVPLSQTIDGLADKKFFQTETGEKVQKILSGIGSAFGLVTDAVSHLIYFGSKLAAEFGVPVLKTIASTLLNVFSNLFEWITNVRDALDRNGAFQGIRDGIDAITAKIREVLGPALAWLQERLEPIKKDVNAFLEHFGLGVVDAIDTDTSDETTLIGKIRKRLEAFAAAFENDALDQRVMGIAESIKAFFKPLTDALEPVLKPIRELFGHIWTGIGDALAVNTSEQDEVFEQLREGREAIRKSLGEAEAKRYTDTVWNQYGIDLDEENPLVRHLKARLKAFGDAFEDDTIVQTVKEIAGKVKTLLEPITQVFSDLGTGLLAFFTEDTSDTEGIAAKLQKRIQAFADAFAQTETGKKITEFADTVRETFKPLTDVLGDLAAGITAFFTEDTSEIEGLRGKLIARIDAFGEAFGDTETARKIGEVTKKIREVFGPLIDVVTFVGDFLNGVWNFATVEIEPGENGETPGLLERLSLRLEAFASAFENDPIVNRIREVASNIEGIFAPLKSVFTDLWKDIAGFVSSLFGGEEGGEDGLDELEADIGGIEKKAGALDGLSKTLGGFNPNEIAQSIGGFFGSILAGMVEATRDIGVEDIAAFGLLLAEMETIHLANKLAKVGTDLATAFSGFIESVREKGLINTLRGADHKKTPLTKMLPAIATSVLEIAGAIKLIADAVVELAGIGELLPDEDSVGLLPGVAALMAILGEIAVIVDKVTPGGSDKTFKFDWKSMTRTVSKDGALGINTGTAILELGIALERMANAVKTLSGIENVLPDDDSAGLLPGVAALMAILGEIAVIVDKVTPGGSNKTFKFDWKSMTRTVSKDGALGINTGTAILELGIALERMANAVKTLSGIENVLPDDDSAGLASGVGSLLLILWALSSFVGSNKSGGKSSTFTENLRGSWAEGLSKSIEKVTGRDGVFGINTGTAIVELSYALERMAGAVKTLSDLPVYHIDDAGNVLDGNGLLGGVGSMLLIMRALSNFVSGNKSGGVSSVKDITRNGLAKTIREATVRDGAFSVDTGFAITQLADGLVKIAGAVDTLSKLPTYHIDDAGNILDGNGLLSGVGSLLIILFALHRFLGGSSTPLGQKPDDGLKGLYEILGGITGSVSGNDLKSLASSLKDISAAVKALAEVPVYKVDEGGNVLEGNGLLAGVGSLILLMAAIGVFMGKTTVGNVPDGGLKGLYEILGGITGSVSGNDLKSLADSISTISTAVERLSNIKTVDFNKGGGGLAAGVIALGVLLTEISTFLNESMSPLDNFTVSDFTSVASKAVQLKSVADSVNTLSLAMERLGGMSFMKFEKVGNGFKRLDDASGIGEAATAMGVMLGEIGIFLNQAFQTTDLTGSAKQLMGGFALDFIATALEKIANSFEKMGKLENDEVVRAAVTEGGILFGIAVLMRTLGEVSNPGAALKAIESMAIFIGGFEAVALALGALYKIPGFQELILKGQDAFRDIGAMLGNIVGGFLGGMKGGEVAATANALDEDTLGSIAETLALFGTKAEKINTDAITNATDTIRILSELSSTNLDTSLYMQSGVLMNKLQYLATGLTDIVAPVESLANLGDRAAAVDAGLGMINTLMELAAKYSSDSPDATWLENGVSNIHDTLSAYKNMGKTFGFGDSIFDLGAALGKDIIDGFSETLKIGDDGAAALTIRPVIDLDDSTRQAAELRGLLGGFDGGEYTANIVAAIDAESVQPIVTQLEAIGSTLDTMRLENRAHTSTINTSVDDVYDRLGNLATYISQLKIQLDSNVLAGELVGPIDRLLGEMSGG